MARHCPAPQSKPEIRNAARFQLLLHPRQQRDILLHAHAPHKTQHKVPVVSVAIAPRRMKTSPHPRPRCIRWHGRSVCLAPAARTTPDWAQTSTLRHRIEIAAARRSVESSIVARHRARRSGSKRFSSQPIASPHIHAHWCATRRQRHVQIMRQPRTQQCHFAGSGNVNQSGRKLAHHAQHQGKMPQNPRRIEPQVLIQRKRQGPARQTPAGHFPSSKPLPSSAVRAVAGAHAKKRQAAPPRKRLKVARRMRHAIDLVKRIGKIRDACQRDRNDYVRDAEHSLSESEADQTDRVLAQRQPQLARFAPRHAQARRKPDCCPSGAPTSMIEA